MCESCPTSDDGTTRLSRRALLAAGVGAPVALAGAGASGAAAPQAVGGARAKVLVFTRTYGYRHASIPNAIETITQLGRAHGFEVVATEDPDRFTDRHLEQYGAIVFVNTVGIVLTPGSRAAISRFVSRGGGWVGVHSAADTEYEWDFYSKLLSGGASSLTRSRTRRERSSASRRDTSPRVTSADAGRSRWRSSTRSAATCEAQRGCS